MKKYTQGVRGTILKELKEGKSQRALMNELTYHCEGDYLNPDLLPSPSPQIGAWGERRKRYLQQYHDALYTGLLLSGKLNAHLEEIDRSAHEMFDLLMTQYAAREGVTEKLKAENQMEWVRRMNDIRERVEEIIITDLICN